MANNTYRGMTNRLLRQRGLPEIVSDDVFNQPNAGLMARYQLVARELIAIIHEMACVDLPVNFARRRFELPIDNVQGAIYPLDTGMSIESLTFDSFRNITPNASGPLRLANWTYEYFSARYDQSMIPSAPPTNFIILPVERTAASPIYRVRIYPNPDKAYTIEYIAQLNPYSLVNATDTVLYPPEYEHVILMEAAAALEDLLGEGKGGSIYVQAQRAHSKARQKATAPRAEKRAVRMKKMFSGRRSFGYYDSPDDGESYSTTPNIR